MSDEDSDTESAESSYRVKDVSPERRTVRSLKSNPEEEVSGYNGS